MIEIFDLNKVPPYFEEKSKDVNARCIVVIAIVNEMKLILNKIK